MLWMEYFQISSAYRLHFACVCVYVCVEVRVPKMAWMINLLYLHTITYIFLTFLLIIINLLSKNYLVMFAKAVDNTMAHNKH